MLELKSIKIAARQAAELTRRVRALHLTGAHKDGQEPVTLADYGSQAIICRALKTAFPDDGIVAEESAEQFLALVSPEDRARVGTVSGRRTGRVSVRG